MNDDLVFDSARRLLADLTSPATIRSAEQGQFAQELWQAVEEAGFLEALGETPGWAGIADAAAILRAGGATTAPIPLAGGMLARRLMGRAGIHQASSDRPPGIVLAMTPRALYGSTGVRWFWPHDTVGVIACWPNGWALVKSGGSTAGRNYAGEPWWLVENGADAPTLNPYPEGCSFDDCQQFMAMSRAALMAGAMVEVLKLTIEHANTRVQFGKPLGKQPAVQHQLALMAEQVAAAEVSVEYAVRRWAGDTAPEIIWRAVATAKIRAGEAAGKVAEMAHQIHGAIGFTREYRLQDLTRRLWTWRDAAGAESEWAHELGKRLIAGGADKLWPALTE